MLRSTLIVNLLSYRGSDLMLLRHVQAGLFSHLVKVVSLCHIMTMQMG